MRKHSLAVSAAMSIALTLALVAVAMAADPFTGTWQRDPSKTESSNPPLPLTWTNTSTGNGISIQVGTGKPTIYEFGKDYTNPAGNVVNHVRVNDHTHSVTIKRDGKIVGKTTLTVSPGGMHAISVEEVTNTEEPFKMILEWDRVGSAPKGDAFFGTWQVVPRKAKREPPITSTIKVDGDTLDYRTSLQHIITAKFDGKEHKMTNSNTTWRLKRIDDHTIEILEQSPTGSPTTVHWQVKGNMLIQTSTGTQPDGQPFKNVNYHERIK